MELNNPHDKVVICTLVAIDFTDFFYAECSLCKKIVCPTFYFPCRRCNSTFKRLFRVHISIGTDTEILLIVMFDRAARVLFGCSADELVQFFELHSSAAKEAGKILEGEMLKVTLSKSKNDKSQHLRGVSVVPLRSGFRPLMATLKDMDAAKMET